MASIAVPASNERPAGQTGGSEILRPYADSVNQILGGLPSQSGID